MKRERDAETDYEVDRWTVDWCLKYDHLMVRVTAAAGNPAQMRLLEEEAEALTQAGRDRFAA